MKVLIDINDRAWNYAEQNWLGEQGILLRPVIVFPLSILAGITSCTYITSAVLKAPIGCVKVGVAKLPFIGGYLERQFPADFDYQRIQNVADEGGRWANMALFAITAIWNPSWALTQFRELNAKQLKITDRHSVIHTIHNFVISHRYQVISGIGVLILGLMANSYNGSNTEKAANRTSDILRTSIPDSKIPDTLEDIFSGEGSLAGGLTEFVRDALVDSGQYLVSGAKEILNGRLVPILRDKSTTNYIFVCGVLMFCLHNFKPKGQ